MIKCFLCENETNQWMLYGNESLREPRPICFNCLKQLIDSDGKNTGLKNRIESWLKERKCSFTQINEPADFFHFTLRDMGQYRIIMDIFQKKENSYLIIGFMIFLNKELSNVINKFSTKQKESFKKRVDDFLSKIRVDQRIGYNVGYEIISENANYGAKYFVKSKVNDCTKEKFFKMLELAESTAKKSGEFINKEITL